MNITIKTFDGGEIQTAVIRDGDGEYVFENKHLRIDGRRIKELSFAHNAQIFLTLTAFQESTAEHACTCCTGKLAFRLRGDRIDYQTSIRVRCGRTAEYETQSGNDIRITEVNLSRLDTAKNGGSDGVCRSLPESAAEKLRVFEPVLEKLVEYYRARSRSDTNFGGSDAFTGTPNQSASFWGTVGKAACWAAAGAGTALCCGATAGAGCVACGAGFGAAASICSDSVDD